MVFGRLQTECGHTPDQIRAMTLDDVSRLSRYWQQHPPVQQLLHAIAVWAGAVKPPSEPRKKTERAMPAMSLSDMQSLVGG